MADTVEFELVAPEELLFSEPVELVVVPGAEGDFGVLPGHSPLISTLRTGVIAVYENDAVNRRIFVSGGFAEVTPERCTVLADEAVALETADRASIEERVKADREAVDAADEADKDNAVSALAVSEALLAALDTAGQA
ncbi:MAG: F0F1 ATP synthase subunit epsilon [Rhodospirillaceae bacterium]|nr:F0F1 ATP synthase subunit epsilon [Rhodospirillaceae bacterium]|tara:strand:- start:14523 stop:14936 length:414 start_codon:yes stop_codon:yes gene_type:complete